MNQEKQKLMEHYANISFNKEAITIEEISTMTLDFSQNGKIKIAVYLTKLYATMKMLEKEQLKDALSEPEVAHVYHKIEKCIPKHLVRKYVMVKSREVEKMAIDMISMYSEKSFNKILINLIFDMCSEKYESVYTNTKKLMDLLSSDVKKEEMIRNLENAKAKLEVIKCMSKNRDYITKLDAMISNLNIALEKEEYREMIQETFHANTQFIKTTRSHMMGKFIIK